MTPDYPTRRDVLQTVAASGLLLGVGVSATGTVAAQSDGRTNHLLVFGAGTVTEYQFSVPGHDTVEKTADPGTTGVDPSLVTVNASDVVTETTVNGGPVTRVSGRTTNQADAYYFTGDPRSLTFSASRDDAVVYLNGVRRDPRYVGQDPWFGGFVLFYGGGAVGTYEFTATGAVAKVTYTMGAPVGSDAVGLNPTDEITEEDGGTVVSGRTTSQADAYTFEGELTSIRADPSVLVYVPPTPSVVVRQTGCVTDDYFGPLGVVALTNLGDQWVFLGASGDPMGDGILGYLEPGETNEYRVVFGTTSVDATVVPGPDYAFVGPAALVNGRLGGNTVTVTPC